MDNVNSAQELVNNEGVARYLRRLYHHNTRALMQLNRVITLLEQGDASQLTSFLPVLQALNDSNTVAIDCINQLNQQRVVPSPRF